MKKNRSVVFILLACALINGSAPELVAQTSDSNDAKRQSETVPDLGTVEVQAPRVANINPIGTFATPITQLRFEPLVDVQSRNLAEAQGDISIRGGLFTGTDFQLGAASIYDPQTGHYFAEIPLDPLMLSTPEVLTGVDNAFSGFNATAGTIAYSLQPIKSRLETSFGAGSREFNLQRGYAGGENLLKSEDGSLNMDLSAARSESAGTRANGRHNFNRFSGRMQYVTENSQTDLAGGYQEKDFSWPNLYALQELHDAVKASGVESEDLYSTLAFLNHKYTYGEAAPQEPDSGSFVQASAYYRRNRDNYEFDRFNPGLFNRFEHTSDTYSAGLNGRHEIVSREEAVIGTAVKYDGQFLYDDLDSTALTFGSFSTRSYEKFSVLPEFSYALNSSNVLFVETGAGYDNTNRDPAALSPLVRVALQHRRDEHSEGRVYVEFSKATRVPDYTAIGSNPGGGLFRGNQTLTRERSYNVEGGLNLACHEWKNHSAVFYRWDNDLVDWTYDSAITPFASRTANNVDLSTFGVEDVLEYRGEQLDLVFGYTYLDKNDDYGVEGIDASFYALNYAQHRATAAVTYRILEQLHLKVDNEYRHQARNQLRDSTDDPVLTYAALSWFPEAVAGLELSAVVDNPFKVSFEEVPGVPGEGRLAAVVGTYRWE